MNKGIAIHTIESSHMQEGAGSSPGLKENSRAKYIDDAFRKSSDQQQPPRRKSGKVKHNHVTPSSNDWSFPIW